MKRTDMSCQTGPCPGLCRVVFLITLLLGSTAWAQGYLEPAGGGPAEVAQDQPCLNDFDRERIREELDRNIAQLQAEGRLPQRAPNTVALSWPLAPASGLADPGYHGTSNFVDLNSAFPNFLLDYNCGARTYDTSDGYNHSGIDYITWPFWWYKMDFNQVAIRAAAPGTIIGKDDGNFDRSCTFGGNWNAVYVQQADGSQAWYGHMKTGSLTSKPVGSSVAAGEYLGLVGSSGSSTNPHLHFEIHTNTGTIVEPHGGPCNSGTSWWSAQRPYYDSAVNLVATHSNPPELPPCPMREIPHFEDHFDPGATLITAFYYRDQRANEVSQYRIYRPNNTIWQSWSHSFPSPGHYIGSYWYWTWTLPTSPVGRWRVEVTYKGVTRSHEFGVGTRIFSDGFESGNTSNW